LLTNSLPSPPHAFRLNTAEEQLELLRQENSRLRSGAATAPAGGKRSAAGLDDSTTRDANWRLQQLQTQYDFLVSKTSSQSQAYKQMEAQIDESAQKVRDLRRTLEELRHEKDMSDTKADRADELERVVSELRQANRSLEDKISRLCEAPFISDAFGQSESRSRFEDAASEREGYRAKISHLQEAVRTHFSALTSLKQQANQLREEKEAAEKKAEDLRLKYQELETGSSVMQDKLRLFSGDDGVDYESLERALTLVKRRGEALEKLPFLEDPEGEKLVTLPVMKRKLEEVQVMNLKLTEEVERFENMLKLQSGINKDLHKELEAMVHKRDKDKRDLQQRLEDLEELAQKRLNKIQSLEAQVRQLVYGMSKKGGDGKALVPRPEVKFAQDVSDRQSNAPTVISDNALLNELIEERGGDLSPDENLLEVWVKSASVADGTLPAGSSVFVVVDFFDYESQTTSLVTSLKPQWDFAATYKINVDDFFLRYLATDVIVFELNMASQGDFAMLARCTVPLSALLKSKPLIRLTNQPLISVRTGEITAHLNAEIRLAIPVSELYRLFLERHPTERRHIEDKSTRLILDAASALDRAQQAAARSAPPSGEDESRLYNELEISVLKAVGLPTSFDGKAPSSYVHFQFLGHPDKFTNPVSGSQEPAFNERFLFAMVTNDQQLRLLQRSRLQLTVIDMRGEENENEDPSEGLIGEVNVALGELAEGHAITDLFPIKNAEGKNVAELQLSIRWKHTFRKQRELGPRALSGVEVETLISAFSASEISEGTVDYRAFCRFIDPPHDVRRVMDRLRNFSVRTADKEGRTPRSIFTALLDDPNNIDEEAFVQKMLLTQIEALPVDFSRLFQFVDMDEDNHITLDQFLAVLNLDEVAAVPGQLQEKLRERTRDLEARGIWALRIFEEADQWGANGIVTRMEFKSVLKQMGFMLADEPDATELMEAHIKNVVGAGGREHLDDDHEADLLNDTLGSGDEVLLHNDPDAPERGRVGTGKKELQELAKQQRELFDARSKEALDQRQAAIHEAERQQGRENKDPNGPPRSKPRPQTAEELAADPYKSAEHRVALSSNAGKGSSKDATELDLHAAKVQSAVRGSQARASLDAPPGVAALALPSESSDPSRPVDILVAEDAIRLSLKELQGVQPEPNLLAGFKSVDTRGSGFVNRSQFAHVMSQFEVIKLNHAELRSCMDFFDLSTDGSKIDYSAFVRLCRYREPEPLPAVQKLQKMVLGPDAVFALRAYDANGLGSIKRAEMLRVLTELGLGSISSTLMLSMVELFETKVEGQVNYANFVEYVRENPACLELDAVSARLYELISGRSSAVDDKTLRTWFKKIDNKDKGRFGSQELSEFFISQNMFVSKEVVSALLAVMEKGQPSVNFSDFSSWVRAVPTSSRTTAAAYANLSSAELQKKANAFMLSVAKNGASAGVTLDDVAAAYGIYDWRKPATGLISKGSFIKATKRAGFVFTLSEYRMLSSEFGDGAGNVAYRKFLSWATPDVGGVAAGSDAKAGPTGSAGAIIRFLEKKLQAGTDLLSVFARYDAPGAGRITSDEFCAAIGDLGMSSATQKEALDVADRYKAAVGNFVMYRKVVKELLQHMDEVTGAATIDVVEVLRAALQRSRVEVRRLRDLFEYYDRKSTGMVREEDLGTVFEEARVRLKKQEVDAVADRYATGNSGWVKYTTLLSTLESRLGEGTAASKPSTLTEELCTRLRDLLEALILRGKDFRGEFDRFDDSFSGSVPQADFREVLQERLRASLPMRDLEALEKTYRDPNDPRRVSFVRLLHDMHPRRFGGRAAGATVLTDEDQVWEIAENLRQRIRKRCDYASTGELRRPFVHFATGAGANPKNASGVTYDNLALGLRELGMRVAGDQLKALFDMINLGGAKTFSYSDFVVFVRDPLHSDVVWKLKRLIARAKTSEKEVLASLKEQDSNASGLLTAVQFNKALTSCGIELSEADVARLLLRFDTEEVQRLDLDKFIKFMRGQPSGPDDEDVVRRSTTGGEDVESQAWQAVRTRVEDKLAAGFSPSEVFAFFDYDNRGTIDLAALQRGSREIGAALTRPEARAIMRRMATLAGGPVNRDSFFEALQVSTKKSRRDTEDDRRDRDRDRDLDDGPRRRGADEGSRERGGDIDALFLRLKDRLESQSALKAAFKDVAVQRSGSASLEELTKIFDRLELRATRRDVLDIFKALDPRMTDFVKIDAVFKMFSPQWEYDSGSSSYDDRGRDRDRDRERDRATDRDSRERASTKAAPDAASVLRRQTDLAESLVRSMTALQRAERVTIDDLRADLRKADSSRTGELERGDFARVLSRFGFKMSAADERHLTDSLGEGRSGIDYLDFCDALKRELERGEMRDEMRVEMRESRLDASLDDVLERLKKRISRDLKHGKSLSDEFHAMDTNGDGELSVAEIERGMDRLGLPLTREESIKLVQRFPGGSKTESIYFKDFVKYMSGAAGLDKEETINELVDRIQRVVEDRLGSSSNAAATLKRVFEDMDDNGDGRLSESEFRRAMADMKVRLSLLLSLLSILDPTL